MVRKLRKKKIKRIVDIRSDNKIHQQPINRKKKRNKQFIETYVMNNLFEMVQNVLIYNDYFNFLVKIEYNSENNSSNTLNPNDQ